MTSTTAPPTTPPHRRGIGSAGVIEPLHEGGLVVTAAERAIRVDAGHMRLILVPAAAAQLGRDLVAAAEEAVR